MTVTPRGVLPPEPLVPASLEPVGLLPPEPLEPPEPLPLEAPESLALEPLRAPEPDETPPELFPFELPPELFPFELPPELIPFELPEVLLLEPFALAPPGPLVLAPPKLPRLPPLPGFGVVADEQATLVNAKK